MKNNKNDALEPSKEEELNPLLRLLIDFTPLAVFFIANAKWGIINATAAFMVASTLSLVITYLLVKKLSTMPLITGVFVLFFGGLTVWLNDETFIKIKPTLVNLIFFSLLMGGLMFKKLFLKIFFGEMYHLQEEGWRKLTIRWGLYFLFLALVNEIIWRNFSNDFWVNFKVFGIMPLTITFALLQLRVVNKYSLDKDDR